jgi:hypothetical protein
VFLAAGARARTPFDSVIRLFQISVSSSVLALILSETALVFACYLAAAYLTLTFAPDVFLFEAGGLLRIALVSTSAICMNASACVRASRCCSSIV